MDEAFSALDPLIRMDMQSVLLDLQKEIKKTIVFITHDLDEALRLGDGVAILRDGEVIQQGTAQDIVLNPADDYIANFVKVVNRGRVIRLDAVMAPVNAGSQPASVRAHADTTLDEAATMLTRAGQTELSVVNGNGEQIGQLDLQRIISAMVTPAAGN
jgi:glycine betaine/proline transport system ATP-binding protein